MTLTDKVLAKLNNAQYCKKCVAQNASSSLTITQNIINVLADIDLQLRHADRKKSELRVAFLLGMQRGLTCSLQEIVPGQLLPQNVQTLVKKTIPEFNPEYVPQTIKHA